jgi:hypothetical protein
MRNINSSPDLGIESDQGRFSSLEATSSGVQIDTPKAVSTVERHGSGLDPDLSAAVINSGECIMYVMQRMKFHPSNCVLALAVCTEPSSVTITCQIYFVACHTEGWERVMYTPVTILDCQTNQTPSPCHLTHREACMPPPLCSSLIRNSQIPFTTVHTVNPVLNRT